MGAEREATLRLGLEGDSEVDKGLDRIGRTGEKTGSKLKSALGGAVKEIGRGFATLAQDSVRVVTAMNTLSLGQAVEQAKRLELAYAKTGVAARQSIGQVKQEIRDLSRYTLTDDATTERLSRAYGKLTYNLRGAKADIRALAQQATADGREIEEELALGKVLRQDLGVVGDLERALGKVRAQADAMGTVGGPAALGDLIAKLGPQLSMVSAKSEEAKGKLTGFLAALTKGYAPEAQQRVGSSVLGTLQARSADIRRTFGVEVLDEQGHLKDPGEVTKKIRDRAMRLYGKKRGLWALRNLFGDEGGSAVANLDPEAMQKAAGVKPSGEAKALHEGMLGTEPAQREWRRLRDEQDMADAATPFIQSQDWFDKMTEGHPLLKRSLGWAAGATASGFTGWLGGKVAVGKRAAGEAASKGGDAMGWFSRRAGAAWRYLRHGGRSGEYAWQAYDRLMRPGAVLRQGAELGGVGLGMAGVGAEVVYGGLSSLAESANLRRERAPLLAKEIGGKLAAKVARGEIPFDESLYQRAGGNRDALEEMLRILAKQQDSLPPDLAEQIGQAVAKALHDNPPRVMVPGENEPVKQTTEKKASGEGWL